MSVHWQVGGSAEEGRFQLGLGTNETRGESSVKVRRCELVEEALWPWPCWSGGARLGERGVLGRSLEVLVLHIHALVGGGAEIQSLPWLWPP